jgi:hypothetical protein
MAQERTMIALSLTIFVSLALAVFFVGLFLIQVFEGGGQPQDALLPIEDGEHTDSEIPRGGLR